MLHIEFLEGDETTLPLVQSLWEKLNYYHQARSPYFHEEFAKLTFSARIESLISQQPQYLWVCLARDIDAGVFVGYCISSINENQIGEVVSMFVEEHYRRQRIGDELIRRAMDWLDSYQVKSKQLSVAYGNEQVLGFYKRYGFYPRRITLIQHTQGSEQ